MSCARTSTAITRHPRSRLRAGAFALHITVRRCAGLFDEKAPPYAHRAHTHDSYEHGVPSSKSAYPPPPSSPQSTKPAHLALLDSHRMQRNNVLIERQAYGIPFHISDDDAMDRVRRYHGSVVDVHDIQHLMMPFWLVSTSTAGTFQADVLQNDPSFVTQPHCLTWIEGPCYQFSYPFGEFMPLNQLSASYEEPLATVEACCAGSHVPSMLLSRFELLHALERMPRSPRLLGFTLSTHTALSLLERRYSRALLLSRIDTELRKFHGSFLRSQVRVTAVRLEAVRIRPVFLPLIKLQLSCASSTMRWTTWVCGAMGKVVSSLSTMSTHRRNAVMTSSAAMSMLCTWTVSAEPGVALAAGVAAAVTVPALIRRYQRWRMLHANMQERRQLQRAQAENVWSDRLGYCWGVESEEQEEYASREMLRRRAQQKAEFEQMVKEEAVRARVRAEGGAGMRVDAKRRLRGDLRHADTLRYYAILGLQGRETTASTRDIVLAFRRAVQLHHPDVHRGAHPPSRGDASSHARRESGHANDTDRSRTTLGSTSCTENSSVSTAETRKEHIQQLIAAYKVLRDPVARKKYDANQMKKT